MPEPFYTYIIYMICKCKCLGWWWLGFMANWPLKGNWVLNSDMYVRVYVNVKAFCLYKLEKKVIFCWIPSHIRIQGNDKADSSAKAAINMTPDKNTKTPYSDLKPKIKQIVTKKWQQLWDENPHNKLFQIQPILKERKLDPNNTRREETTFTRLCIGKRMSNVE